MKRKRQQAGIARGHDADEEEREEGGGGKRVSQRPKKTVNYNLDVDNEEEYSSRLHKHTQDKLLEVRCGTITGILDVRKLARADACIKCNDHWYSPPAFEKLGQKSSIKRWKATIIYKNKPLQFWFEQGFLTSKPYKKGHVAIKKIQLSDEEKEEEPEAEDSEPQSAGGSEEDDVKLEMDETGDEGAECDDGGVKLSEKVSGMDEDDGTENGVMEEEEEEKKEKEEKKEVKEVKEEKEEEEEKKEKKEEEKKEEEEAAAAVVADGLPGSRDAEEVNMPLMSSTPKAKVFQKRARVVLRRLPRTINKLEELSPDEAKSEKPSESSEEAAESEKEPSREDKEGEEVKERDAAAAEESAAAEEGEQESFGMQKLVQDILDGWCQEEVSAGSQLASHSPSPVFGAPASDGTEIAKAQDAESKSEETKEDSEGKEQSNALASEDNDQLCTAATTSDLTPDQQHTTEEDREAKSSSPKPQSLLNCQSSQSVKLTDGHSSDQDSAQPRVTELETSVHETPATKLPAAASSECDKSFHQNTAHAPKAPQTTTSLDRKNVVKMDLNQLKREKLKMQLKVLMLQEEYYSLTIKEMKQKK